jgi:hypothetical protein
MKLVLNATLIACVAMGRLVGNAQHVLPDYIWRIIWTENVVTVPVQTVRGHLNLIVCPVKTAFSLILLLKRASRIAFLVILKMN